MKIDVDNTKIAICTQCKGKAPISGSLAFLELAVDRAKTICKYCRYAPVAHEPDVRVREHLRHCMKDGHAFEPINPKELNSIYYCGCRG